MNNSKLLFRRQFFLGEEFLENYNDWKYFKIKENLNLYAHPELDVSQYTLSDKSITITLIGFMIDPYYPLRNNYEILEKISQNVSSFEQVQKQTFHLSGRWAIIYNSKDETKVFHDPCGMRQVFYTQVNNKIHCGSQPSILNEVLKLEIDNDPMLIDFLKSDQFKLSESAWIGDGSIYKDVKHLLPNHYLDIRNKQVKRFWVSEEIASHNNLDYVATEVARLLKGSIESLNGRYKTMLAVTAGWDSRVLLAASKDVKDKTNYYVSTHNVLKPAHMDIEIPRKLSNKLDLNLETIDNISILENDFIEILKNNVTQARLLPKTLTIQYILYNIDNNYVNINGNGSEIARSFYGDIDNNIVDTKYITNLLGYKNCTYVEQSIEQWLISAKDFLKDSIFSLMDLFYWEQRMGNWGTMYQAEQDIAIEEFSPFNNRKVLMLLMSVDKKYRKQPDYIVYKEIINILWKEALSEPINPLKFKDKIKKIIISLLSESSKTKIKKIING